jgi:hypothetical protein
MGRIAVFFIVTIFFSSCGQVSKNNKDNAVDTIAKKNDEVVPDLKNLRKDYVLTYNKPVDFTCDISDKKFGKMTVLGKYYCLFDNGIVVPSKYNLDDTSKVFTTHNFAENVVVISNGDTLIKKTITKSAFLKRLCRII